MIEELKSELADLEFRRIELRAAHGARDVAVAAARDSLIGGNDGALHTVTETHSASEALRAAVNALDERIEQKRGELADAEREATRLETFEHRRAIMRRGEELLTAYLAVRAEVNDELKRRAEQMIVAFDALQANRNAWLASIDVNATFEFDEFIAAGAEPTAVRSQWDGTKRAASDNAYVMPHVLPFEDVLRIVFHVWNEATREESSRAA
ncbi:MAG: hypothetical protein M3R15_21565 [Acidobacteriota bacterium]|nr:hypothetical protein [Acidobacteriota bacterium]